MDVKQAREVLDTTETIHMDCIVWREALRAAMAEVERLTAEQKNGRKIEDNGTLFGDES